MTLALTLAPNPTHPRNNITRAPELTNADADALVQQVTVIPDPDPDPDPGPRPPLFSSPSPHICLLPTYTPPVHQMHNLLDNDMYAAFVSGWHTHGARPAPPSMPYSPDTLPPTKSEPTPSSFHCAWWRAVNSVRVSRRCGHCRAPRAHYFSRYRRPSGG